MNDTTRGGTALIEHSKEQFTAQRSIIGEWFPYIYVASRRMSLRAISRWLKDEQGIKLSVVAIARAMHNEERHWRELAEDIEPAARVFAEAHNAYPAEILSRQELFEALELKPPRLTTPPDGGVPAEYDDYLNAGRVLRNRWFAYPEEVRDQCRRHLGALESARAEREGMEDEKRAGKHKRSRRTAG